MYGKLRISMPQPLRKGGATGSHALHPLDQFFNVNCAPGMEGCGGAGLTERSLTPVREAYYEYLARHGAREP
jgi:hypothetical protein